jgi:Niemann-Pick C1 protein
LNVGLAILAVGVIVFLTVASPGTSILITANVAACIVDILGFMNVLGIVIDSISVINIVLAVGLSVDYSAHVGHCFMVKGGTDSNKRASEALADIGAAVLSGAISTFLVVVVLLFSSSYVFVILSRQFALTVGLGIAHGLVCLPVLLAIFGPKSFSSAKDPDAAEDTQDEKQLAQTDHSPDMDSTENDKNNKLEGDEPKSDEDDA